MNATQEIFGFHRARVAIYSSIILSLLFAVLIQSILLFPISTSNSLSIVQNNYKILLRAIPWNLICMSIAVFIADLINVIIFHALKHFTRCKYLWLRAITSNCISLPIHFYLYSFILSEKILPEQAIFVLYGVLAKIAVMVLLLPVLYLIISCYRSFQTVWGLTNASKYLHEELTH